MVKWLRFTALAVLAAMCMLQASPAVAQEETTMMYEQTQVVGQAEPFEGFGVVESIGELADGTPGYGLVVSEDTAYYLEGDFDFESFIGERVYVTGQIDYTGGTRVLLAESIEAAGTSEGGLTVAFELTTEGMVPEGESFYAYAPDGYNQQLTDPDGDGVYTGSLAFSAESLPADQQIPLSIGGLRDAANPNGYTIKDFGFVGVEDGQTFSATFAFGAGEGTSMEGTTGAAEGTILEQTVVGQAAEAPDAGEQQQGGIFEEGGALGFLPDSGGTAILVLAAGALLVGGGLLAYRFTR